MWHFSPTEVLFLHIPLVFLLIFYEFHVFNPDFITIAGIVLNLLRFLSPVLWIDIPDMLQKKNALEGVCSPLFLKLLLRIPGNISTPLLTPSSSCCIRIKF